jgi:hypothetical protein
MYLGSPRIENDGRGIYSSAYNSREINQGTMSSAKRIIYKYSSKLLSDELEVDLTGELSFKQGDLIARCGKDWKIDSIFFEKRVGDDPRGMHTFWLSLIELPVN